MGFLFQFCDIKKLDESLAKFVQFSLKKNPKKSQNFLVKKDKICPQKQNSLICKRKKSPKALSKGLTHGGKKR
jgi:hypothetical protein